VNFMAIVDRRHIISTVLFIFIFVSLKYWLSFVIKMKRKEPSVRTGFIAVRT
jgi:hypothetical protein